MTRQEIRREHKEIVERRRSLNRDMERLMLEWRQLQLECDHKDKYQTSTMGDLGVRCPDCGYST